MKSAAVRDLAGAAGRATLLELTERDPAQVGTVAAWLLVCPHQSAGWSHFMAAVVHLRPLDGAPDAHLRWPKATHEVLVYALDSTRNPSPSDPASWCALLPLNVCEQLESPLRRRGRRAARASPWPPCSPASCGPSLRCPGSWNRGAPCCCKPPPTSAANLTGSPPSPTADRPLTSPYASAAGSWLCWCPAVGLRAAQGRVAPGREIFASPLALWRESCYGSAMTTTAPASTLRHDGRWIKGRFAGFEICALAFAEPSTYGIGGNDADLAGRPLPASARISKLWVAVPASAGSRLRTVVYDYDRDSTALDLLLPGELDQILAAVLAVEVL